MTPYNYKNSKSVDFSLLLWACYIDLKDLLQFLIDWPIQNISFSNDLSVSLFSLLTSLSFLTQPTWSNVNMHLLMTRGDFVWMNF